MSTPRHWPGLALAGLFGLATLASTIGAALSPARAQADRACQPFDQGIDVVIGFAKKSGSQLVVVPHAQMQAFIAGLGDRGKGIIGDSALVLMGPQREVVLFIKHGNMICIEAASDSHPDTTAPSQIPDAM